MTKPDWLKEIETLLPMLLDTVKKCDDQFQPKCFELLLGHALTGGAGTERISVSTKDISATPTLRPGAGGGPLLELLTQANIDLDALSDMIDLQTGDVLATNLGRDKAEAQRKIAVLIAVRHLANNSSLMVPTEELVRQSKNQGVYDSTNFSTYMKRTKTSDGRGIVFVKDGDNWRVAAPGRTYLIETLKQIARSAE